MAGIGRPKGSPKPEGAGRVKGTPNKFNKELKDMILGALEDAGGQEYLRKRALDTPGPFMALVGKILPKNIDAKVESNVIFGPATEYLDELINRINAARK